MDLKQLTPTQLAVGAGLLVLLLLLLLLLWLLGRSRGKARRRRARTEAALADAPTAGFATPPAEPTPPTEPTPTQPPALPPSPGAGRSPGAGSGAGRTSEPDQPGEEGLTLFGSTPQSRGPYRVVQHSGDPIEPRTAEPYPNDRLAAEQERVRSATPPQPRASLEPTFDQPEQPRPPHDPTLGPESSRPDPGADSGPESPQDFGSGSASGAPRADLPPGPVGWPRSGSSAGGARPTEGEAVADRGTDPDRNGLVSVPEPAEGGPVNGLTGDARDRLLRVLLADPDRALHAVGDLETSRGQLDRLNDSMHHQRQQLADAARRLRGAGLTPAQVAQLAGFGEGELVSLLSEHTPSPTPRPTPDPPH
ncbi:MAG TPA: hypothetical protein VH008_31345 [Pseudonocardia sp.]|nr:hypothetical protein [Pseudonocardia sp.]